MTGTIKFYNEQKGFGFIIPSDGGENIFFHVTRCDADYQEQLPKDGDHVTYEIETNQDRDGNERTAAVNVTFVDHASEEEQDQQ